MEEFPVVSQNDDVECRLCKGDFKLPVKVLQCGHSYCGPCLLGIGMSGQVQCPACHVVTFLSIHGVAGLPNNFALHSTLNRIGRKAEMNFALMGPPPTFLGMRPNFANPHILSLPVIKETDDSGGDGASACVSFGSTRSVGEQRSTVSSEVPSLCPTPSISPIGGEHHSSSVASKADEVETFVGPIGASLLAVGGAVVIPSRSSVRLLTTGISVVTGDNCLVVVGPGSTVAAGASCKLFSQQPMLPQPPADIEVKALGQNQSHVHVGSYCAVYTAAQCRVKAGDGCEVWLGPKSTISEVGPYCVWHTAVKGAYV